MGSIMCAASGLVGIMLPGVGVALPDAGLISIFPEFTGSLPDPIMLPGTVVGDGCWVEQADKIKAMEIRINGRKTFMKLITSSEKDIEVYPTKLVVISAILRFRE
jgi:hypothetical protein